MIDCVLCYTPVKAGEKTGFDGQVHEDCMRDCADVKGDDEMIDIVEHRLEIKKVQAKWDSTQSL